jgi:ADP-heptose:LPS heptosyltransferase
MAEPTEQNPAIVPVKVIAIKLPYDLQERILTFPFLHSIREKYPDADIHFITPKKNIEVLNLLPFTAYYHEYDEEDLKSIFDAHRFWVKSKIFNVWLYISLTNSLTDAVLGLSLRAKVRLGFSDGWKTLFFNQKVSRPNNQHVVEDFFALYKEHVKANVSTKLRVMSRELKPVIADWDSEPYIAINLAPLRDMEFDYGLIELINRFDHQKIVLFASEDQERIQFMIEPFLRKLTPLNTYVNFVYKDWIDLSKMLAFSRGVITYNGPIASISAYVGAKTLILYDSEDPQKYGPFYFLADVMVMAANDPTAVNNAGVGKVIKNRITFNMEEVAKRAFDFFKM